MDDKEKIEAFREFLEENEDILNLSGVGRKIEMEPNNLRKAIRKQTDSKGTTTKIPVRSLPALQQMANDLKKSLKKIK